MRGILDVVLEFFRRSGWLALLLMLFVFGTANRAQAHPHAWIDVQSTVVLDDAGRVAAIEQEWLFDALYSAALIDGMTAGQTLRPEVLAEYTRDVIDNLGPYGYFMRVRADGHSVPLARVTKYQGVLREDKRFVLRFTAPLTQALDPVAQHLEFSVYDPTYFIQMMHKKSQPPTLRGTGVTTCRAHVQAPNPSPAMFARALALDRGAKADDTLGEMFAQKVRLQCG